MKLKEIRENRNYSQTQIANVLNIKQNTYSQYETEKRQIPIESLIKLSGFYNVSVDYLLGLTNIEEKYPLDWNK